MEEELDTHAHKHISYISHKNKFPILTYTRAQRRGWRLVCEREQGPPSVFQPNESGWEKGKGERRAVVVYHHQDLYPQSALLMFLLDLSYLMTLCLSEHVCINLLDLGQTTRPLVVGCCYQF
jgi:hypothetical protein